MFGSTDERAWRQNELLAKHTLLAVVSFPFYLFSPAAKKQVVGVFVKKGRPHPKSQPVFWARVAHDGHLMVKAKRLPASELRPPRNEPDEIPTVLPDLRNFVANPGSVRANIPMLCKTAPINFDDPLLELLPEVYLDSKSPDAEALARMTDAQIRGNIAALVDMDLRHGAAEAGQTIIDTAAVRSPAPPPCPRSGRDVRSRPSQLAVRHATRGLPQLGATLRRGRARRDLHRGGRGGARGA